MDSHNDYYQAIKLDREAYEKYKTYHILLTISVFLIGPINIIESWNNSDVHNYVLFSHLILPSVLSFLLYKLNAFAYFIMRVFSIYVVLAIFTFSFDNLFVVMADLIRIYTLVMSYFLSKKFFPNFKPWAILQNKR